jgi:hypothetical protein
MPRFRSFLPLQASRLFTIALLFAGACSSKEDGGGGPSGPTAAIALSLNPNSATVVQGGSFTVTGTLTRSGGFTGDVDLFLVNAPSTVTATATAQTVGTTTTAVITVLVGATTAAQSYVITVLAQAPGVTNATAQFTLTVTATQGNFTLGISPAGGVTLAQGTIDNSKSVTITRTNYTADITLTADNLPTGLTAAFAPNPASGNNSALTLTASATVAPGAYSITLRGTGPAALRASGDTANLEATTTLAVTVTAAGSFTLGITPAGGVTLSQGTTNTSKTVTNTRTSYTANVTLTAEGLPAGLTAAFAGNPVSGNSSVLTLTASASVAPSTYNITIRGTGPAALRAPDDTAYVESTIVLAVTVTAAGSFALSITPTGGVTLQQGAVDNSKTVTITRTNYTANVTLTAENLPTGLTAAFAPNPTGGNSSVLTLTASAGVTPNTYTITILGTGPAALRAPGETTNVEATTTLSVTITAAPAGSFTLGITPAGGVTMQQGSTNNSKTVTITRTNYTANVTLTAENLPTGLTAAFAPNPTGGNSSVLTFTASASVTPNTYSITIRGTGPAALRTPGSLASVEATTTIAVTITTSGAPVSINVSFVGCTTSEKPAGFFVQDGTGPWVRVIGSSDVYSFTITQGKGGILYATSFSPRDVRLQYFVAAELAVTNPYRFCFPDPPFTSHPLTGTLAGKGSNDVAWLYFGDAGTPGFNGSFTIFNHLAGSHDLVGYLGVNAVQTGVHQGANDRVTILRDQSGSAGSVDLATGQTLLPGTLTVVGAAGGETIRAQLNYRTGASCDFGQLNTGYLQDIGSVSTFYGVRPTQQRATDFHQLTVNTSSLSTGGRELIESFNAMGNRTATMGAPFPAPTVTRLPASHLRVRVIFTLPAGYQSGVSFTFSDGGGPFGDPGTIRGIITASFGYLGSAGSQTLEFPDMSGVAGWSDQMAPATPNLPWFLRISDVSHAGNRCVEGARTISAVRSGSF